jgi:hypothetical protein
MAEDSSLKPNGFNQRVRHFAEVLNPLFWDDKFYVADTFFEYVCTLVRAGGVQSAGWDPYYESQAVLDDLKALADLEFPEGKLRDPKRTRVRLALLSYCHVTEMDLPYSLLANLLGLRLGRKYCLSPFRDLAVPVGKKKGKGLITKVKPPSPGQKIKRVKELAIAAQRPAVAESLEQIYDRVIRNAVYHSDYVLHENAMHLIGEHRISKRKGYGTQVIEYDELFEVVNDAFAFYSALLSLYERARNLIKDFKSAFLPFDSHYKGLLELIFDANEKLIGFRTYWPNGSMSEYSRTKEGCMGVNLVFNPDGSINFMVGLYASKPGKFSPLVEENAEPIYAPRPGTEIRPYWPSELRTYKLPPDIDENSEAKSQT